MMREDGPKSSNFGPKGTQDNNMKTRMWCFDELGTAEVTLKPPIIFKKALSSLF